METLHTLHQENPNEKLDSIKKILNSPKAELVEDDAYFVSQNQLQPLELELAAIGFEATLQKDGITYLIIETKTETPTSITFTLKGSSGPQSLGISDVK